MNSVTKVRLGELMRSESATIDPRRYPDEAFDLYSIPAFDVGRPDAANGAEIGSAKQVVEPSDVLLSRIVPHIRRAWVVGPRNGKRQIASGEWMVFRSRDIEPRYLRHMLMGDDFHARFMMTVAGVGGSLLRARPKHVAEIEVPLPSMAEQRRIAAILDQADALRAKRRETLAQLDEMARAIFVEMFGDLTPQNCPWPRQAFEQFVADARIGLVRSSSEIGSEHPHRYLKMDAIGTNGGLDLTRATRTFAAADEVRTYSLAPGDFLFNTRNSRELVGKSAIFRSSVPHLFNNNIMRIRFREDVAADYVLAAFRTPALQREIETKKSGTTSVFAIYWKDLKTLQVPIPPKPLQSGFVERIDALRASAETQKRQGAELDGLFTSLQHRAFRGEL